MDRMISDEDLKAIGGKMRDLRLKLGFSQQEMASELYWTVSSYQKIESGKTLMTLDKAAQLHRDYNVDLNYLIADDPLDSEDVIIHVLGNAPKDQSDEMIIRLLEYLIRIIKMSQKKGNETDTNTGR